MKLSQSTLSRRAFLAGMMAGPVACVCASRVSAQSAAQSAAKSATPLAAPPTTSSLVPPTSAAASSTVAPPTSVAPAPGADVSLIKAELAGRSPSAWGMDLPGIVSTIPTTPGVKTLALTFDACGGPGGVGVDEALLSTLREFGVPATLFLNERWIDANAALTRQLLQDPLFVIQNHGTEHKPLSVNGRAAYGIAGTTSLDNAIHEVASNHQMLQNKYSRTTTWFRSGTAHYDDVCVEMCNRLGQRIAGFATNLDGGATFPAKTVTEQFLDAPDGAICIGHMNVPGSGTAPGIRAGLEALRPKIANGSVRFVALV